MRTPWPNKWQLDLTCQICSCKKQLQLETSWQLNISERWLKAICFKFQCLGGSVWWSIRSLFKRRTRPKLHEGRCQTTASMIISNPNPTKSETNLDWQEYFSQLQDTTDAFPCCIHLPVCLWIMDPHSKDPKKNTIKPWKWGATARYYTSQTKTMLPMSKIQQASRPHEDLLTILRRRKLQWYGHVSCSSGLAKTILQGTVKGGRRQGRQRQRWEDSIREWTGLEFGKSQRAVENREKCRKLVAKSRMVPQRLSRLRDWCWWWCQIRQCHGRWVQVSL